MNDGFDEDLGVFDDDFKIIHSCGGEMEITHTYQEWSPKAEDDVILCLTCKECGKSTRTKL